MFVIINFNRKIPKVVDNNAPFAKNRKIIIFHSHKTAYGYTVAHKITSYAIVIAPPDFKTSKYTKEYNENSISST